MNNIISEFIKFKSEVNIIAVFDHARSGNGFFQTIFDSHKEVLAIPWIHYIYSYSETYLGSKEFYDSDIAHKLWTQHNHYFRLFYTDPVGHDLEFIYKMGGNPDVKIDRKKIKNTFDELIKADKKISRKDLVLAIYYSVAIGLKRDISKIKFILLADTISLRTEKPLNGYSAKIIDQIVHDFKQPILIHLERDPRAGIASLVHQFTNQIGNSYGLKYGNFWSRLFRLFSFDFDRDSVWVFGFWLIHVNAAYSALLKKKKLYQSHFIDIKNEDLNLNFVQTMQQLSSNLGFKVSPSWSNDFKPTMFGKIWRGTGAYNSGYQKFINGPLKNDSLKVSVNSASPNKYVTERWRNKLAKNEIFVIEKLLNRELLDFSYKKIFDEKELNNNLNFIKNIALPVMGEAPSISWIRSGLKEGYGEFINRIFYALTAPIFYVFSRVFFLTLVFNKKIFKK